VFIPGEPPEVWIEGEVLDAYLAGDESLSIEQRGENTGLGEREARAVTEAQLRSMPGGDRAIEDWRAGDYSRRQSYMVLNDMLRATEEAAVEAMSPVEEWDWLVGRYGEDVVEHQWGPRP
jgi:hypothetical protein